MARNVWGLGTDEITSDKLIEVAGLSENVLEICQNIVPRVSWAKRTAPDKFDLYLQGGREDSRRFGLSRLLADQIFWESDDKLRPSTVAITARQKFQRAFGAEFLAPASALEERVGFDIGDEEMLADVASEFGVSDWLVRYQIENHPEMFQQAT